MTTLIIVESPAKAQTIKGFLGKKYTVKASLGHIRDLPRSKLGVDLEHGFEPSYITIRGKGPVLQELREAAKKADRVLLATDPDREGEAIAWHLAEALHIKDEKCRIDFHEITKTQVQQSVKAPRPISQSLVDAQQARRVLDRIVGYKLSPLLWAKVKPGLSAGRVQSVAVKLIVDREREIEAFTAEEYWTATALLETAEGQQFEAKLLSKAGAKIDLPNAEAAQQVKQDLTDADWVVASVKKTTRRRNPAAPSPRAPCSRKPPVSLAFPPKTMRALSSSMKACPLARWAPTAS